MKGKIKKLECPSCGANLTRKFFVGKYKCNYCGTIYTSQNQSTIKIDFTKISKATMEKYGVEDSSSKTYDEIKKETTADGIFTCK